MTHSGLWECPFWGGLISASRELAGLIDDVLSHVRGALQTAEGGRRGEAVQLTQPN